MKKTLYTDHQDPERSRGWPPGQRSLSGIRHIRCDLLQMEDEVWWYDSLGCQKTEGAGGPMEG